MRDALFVGQHASPTLHASKSFGVARTSWRFDTVSRPHEAQCGYHAPLAVVQTDPRTNIQLHLNVANAYDLRHGFQLHMK
jgi:hypothetical protein